MSAEEVAAAFNLHVAALDEADVRSLDRLDRLLRLVARRQREVPCWRWRTWQQSSFR
jgi:hypothetical protein